MLTTPSPTAPRIAAAAPTEQRESRRRAQTKPTKRQSHGLETTTAKAGGGAEGALVVRTYGATGSYVAELVLQVTCVYEIALNLNSGQKLHCRLQAAATVKDEVNFLGVSNTKLISKACFVLLPRRFGVSRS